MAMADAKPSANERRLRKMRDTIEAEVRVIHHYAGCADHPAMKDRIDGDVAYILDMHDSAVRLAADALLDKEAKNA
jgi:hypothetical protein